jgi:phage protein U
MIGSFGNIAFSTSMDKVFTFSGLSKSADARFAEHSLTGKKPLLEFIGPGLETITFNMKLDVFLGINPLEEIKKLLELRDAGIARPFVLGGEFIGLFVITSLSEAHKVISNRGKILNAELSITLKEYADDRV